MLFGTEPVITFGSAHWVALVNLGGLKAKMRYYCHKKGKAKWASQTDTGNVGNVGT